MQPTVRPITQLWRMSVPMPKEWERATGQLRYASQCTARHVRARILWRSQLVTATASSRSTPTEPSATHNRLYDEAKGTTIAAQPMWT